VAKVVLGHLCEPVGCGRIGQVEGQRVGGRGTERQALLREHAQAISPPGGEHKPRALRGQKMGDVAPDARARPGNEAAEVLE